MECFKNKEIIFYTLILNEKENQKIQESPEVLEDFLEDKICSLLNLPHTCEYFLRFSNPKDSNTYHCLLLNKDSLRSYVCNAETFLSHPSLLCAQFLQDNQESQTFLVLDSYNQWTLVHYENAKITSLQAIKSLEMAREKIEHFKQKDKDFLLTLWILGENNTKETQEIQAQFGAQMLSCNLNTIQLLESLNFNPLEKTLPLSKQKIGKALKLGALGVFIGFGVCLALWILSLLTNQEIANLQSQIHEQHLRINQQNQNYTESQKQILLLQEKLDSLQTLYANNAQFLKSAIPNTAQLTPFFNIMNPILEQQNVKIAYLGLEKDLYSLLLMGKNTLQVLETLEKAHLGEIQSLEKYQDFYWIQTRLRIPQ